ncbi:hypothetical protein F4821DRAFT_277680 [Hypoxylon rubiginosum]|uniref:Uncharacterized protein n=1 Tax=Hypoxylon rubiginosum TaxID=110542 RepID=A0ACC0D424_9PEZI|nr:hypothetical protein F4821DRAFT_277680 [Hypoxylon rubiginosum]
MYRYSRLPVSNLSSTSQRSWQLSSPFRSFSATTEIRGRLLTAIRDDHHELGSCYSHIIDNKNADERTRYRNRFVWELARHSVAEEIIVYPAIQEYLKDGQDRSSKDREQHQTIKEQLYRLQGLSADDPDFEPTFRALYSDLQQHVKEEEEHDIPQLEAKLDEVTITQLSKSFERTKHLVPTRSHPLSPQAPPFETVAALLSAPIDKVADIFRKFPKADGPIQ